MAQTNPRGISLGGGGGAVYVGFRNSVVAVTGPGVPLMPNGISVTSVLPPIAGLAATLNPEHMRVGAFSIEWSDARSYDLVLRRAHRALPEVQLPFEPAAPVFDVLLSDLAAALVRGDATAVTRVASALLGRGRGLTPEGDDLLAGAAATAYTLGLRRDAIAAVFRPTAASRTTSLSETLLRLATEGRVAQPLLRLLHDADGANVADAVRGLKRVGGSTGRCYLQAVAAVIRAHRLFCFSSNRFTDRREGVTQ